MLASLLAPALVLSSAAFALLVPRDSSGQATIAPYNNCSGTLTSRPVGAATDTLPKISPSGSVGWERWDITLDQTGVLLNLRWTQGDPASHASKPSNGTFELSAAFDNGTIYETRLTGQKLTFSGSSPYSISIGQNTLTWDDSQAWFNTSLNLNGLTASIATESIMLDSFSPYAGGIPGQLAKGLFFGIPVTRGRSNIGSMTFPWGQQVQFLARSILSHMFATKPLQNLAVSYSMLNLRSVGTQYTDSFIYESSHAPDASVYNAFYLGRAESRKTEFEPYTIYTGTNSNLLSVSQINSTSTEAQLSGCSHTDFVPFTWNYTLPSPVLELTDSAGGTTKFFVSTAVSALEPFGTEPVQVVSGTALGFMYQAAVPNAAGSLLTEEQT
ncbi:hypothetical protein EDC04DRAFT_758456 [Pisolithus marmoratus]|nr:hypothetical protein EDC04DRAFT_758456 [Pisolithus marmoratus]